MYLNFFSYSFSSSSTLPSSSTQYQCEEPTSKTYVNDSKEVFPAFKCHGTASSDADMFAVLRKHLARVVRKA